MSSATVMPASRVAPFAARAASKRVAARRGVVVVAQAARGKHPHTQSSHVDGSQLAPGSCRSAAATFSCFLLL